MPAGRDETHILLIDEDTAERRTLERLLAAERRQAELPFQIMAVDSAEAGIKVLETTEDIDVVAFGMGLAGSVRFKALELLKAARPQMPVIALCPSADLSLVIGALRHGATECLEMRGLLPTALWRSIRCAIERKRCEAKLVTLANTDALTGLFNRRGFFQQLEEAIENTRRTQLACAVIVFDIDRFKEVNDQFGHRLGDSLLSEIAQRVQAQVRKTDSVGRIGGDEFAVVAPNLRSDSGAMEIAEKIRAAVAGIESVNGVLIKPTVSIGIAVFPMDDSPSETLISHADMAMYRSKAKQDGPIHYYDAKMDRQVKAKHLIKKSMLEDIAAGRYFLHYQPIVDTQTGEVVAAEGLARWRDARNRIVEPLEFIPIAEETGWITTLGVRLLEEACNYLRQSAMGGAPTVPISLNLSAVQCRSPHIALQLVSTILHYGVDPHLINFEITESAVIKNVDLTRRNIELLKDIGVGIHIDDFGTGYSSLSILRDLPLDVIKVDKSFVAAMDTDVGARQIVEAIAELSHKMKLKTIAEGVESREQADTLREMGIDYLQGFYFSKPVRIDAFRQILETGRPLGGRETPVAQRVAS